MVYIGIDQILGSMVELFGFIYTAAYFIYDFLVTPLSQTVPGIEELFGEIATYTPFQILFGPAIVLILVFSLVKFVTPL